MTNLSTQTQTIIDAYENTTDKYDALAAVLRALTEYSVMFYDPDEYADAVRVDDILRIAEELESL